MLSFLYVYSDHSILECYNLFSGVELSMRWFCVIEGKLNESIRLFKNTLKGHQTLFIIDDCSAEGEINKKRDALSELAFSGRHRNHSLWVLTQKYNSVSKHVREQIKWLCLFLQKIGIVLKTV